MSGLGKSLEAAARRVRTRLFPSYRKSFDEIAALGLGKRKPGEPLVVFDFSDPAIDAVGSRYYFSLIRDFSDAGYFPVFVLRRATVSNFHKSRIKSFVLKLRIGSVKRIEDLNEPFVLITDSPDAARGKASKVIVADYDHRIASMPGEVAFPVFVHPQIAAADKLPFNYDVSRKRSARIFFGGNTEKGKYDLETINTVYGMLTRREMLAAACDAVPHHGIFRPQNAADWLSSDEAHPFVFCETQHCRIPSDQWLDALGKADFFLACPGVGMPLCHNLVEAMAAGAVPILQYGRYLDPALTDGVNSLGFADEADLKKVIDRVLSMTDDEVLRLREGVRAYFESVFAPGCLARRLVSDPEARILLLNSYRVVRSAA